MSRASTETARGLLRLTTQLMRRVAAQMRQGDAPLTPMQVGMLTKIDEGPCSLTELSQRVAVRLPTASQSIAVLEERGWVERWRSPDDRRQILFRLTPEGRRALKSMKKKVEAFVASLLSGLDADEHEKISCALARLLQAIQPDEDNG